MKINLWRSFFQLLNYKSNFSPYNFSQNVGKKSKSRALPSGISTQNLISRNEKDERKGLNTKLISQNDINKEYLNKIANMSFSIPNRSFTPRKNIKILSLNEKLHRYFLYFLPKFQYINNLKTWREDFSSCFFFILLILIMN